MLRQGDLLLIPITRTPKKLIPVHPEQGRLTLARGEVTGHHHSVDAGAATLGLDEGGTMYMTVEELTEVRHQEHAPIPLAPGKYKVIRQKEYSPEAIRNVAD